jgi:cysteine synthase
VPVEPIRDVPALATVDRQWVDWAVRQLYSDAQRSADTHLLRLPAPVGLSVDLYLKDESTHPTGSLKHRLARSLFLYAICSGEIGPGTTVVEASSGSTAISEAYFARLLRLPFVAVMARSTSQGKIALIEREGGRCTFVDSPGDVYAAAQELARREGGHYLDQFTNAERATDWRGNNNIAESIFEQLSGEPHPVPAWVVVGAGTGGTSATIGRFLRYRGYATRLAVVDPEGSAFLPAYTGKRAEGPGSRIEGIGRPRVEPSFLPHVIDRMIGVPDAASVATMRFLAERFGLPAGPSTGTNIYGALRLACEMHENGVAGSAVTLMCDRSERYATTFGDEDWLAEQGLDFVPYLEVLDKAWSGLTWTGSLPAPPHAISQEEDRDGTCDMEWRDPGRNQPPGPAGRQRVFPAGRCPARVPGPDTGVVGVPVEGPGPVLHRARGRRREQERSLVLPASQAARPQDQELCGVLEWGPSGRRNSVTAPARGRRHPPDRS